MPALRKAARRTRLATARRSGRRQPCLLGEGAASSQSSSGMPQPADRADLREVHVGVDEPGQHEAAAQVDHSSSGCARAQRGVPAALDDVPSRTSRPASASARSVAAGERVLGRVEERAPVERHRVGSRRSVAADRSRSKRRSRSAATLTAIVAGSLPVMSGRPIGVVIRPIRRRVAASASLRRSAPTCRRADQPDRAELRGAQRGVTERGVLGVVVRHDQHVRAGRQLGQHELGQHRHVVDVDPGHARRRAPRGARASSCSARESTRCSSRSCRARMRASSSPTWPDPEDRDSGHHRQRLEQHGRPRRRSTARRAGTAPCPTGDTVSSSGSAGAVGRSARGPGAIATASRLPPPTVPQVRSAHDHLGAGLAWRVPAHGGERDQHAGLPRLAQPLDGAQPAPSRPSVPHVLISRAAPAPTPAPSEGLWLGLVGFDAGRPRRRGRARRRAAPARSPSTPPPGWPGTRGRRWCPAGPNAAAAWRSASRTENASISGGSPTALEP